MVLVNRTCYLMLGNVIMKCLGTDWLHLSAVPIFPFYYSLLVVPTLAQLIVTWLTNRNILRVFPLHSNRWKHYLFSKNIKISVPVPKATDVMSVLLLTLVYAVSIFDFVLLCQSGFSIKPYLFSVLSYFLTRFLFLLIYFLPLFIFLSLSTTLFFPFFSNFSSFLFSLLPFLLFLSLFFSFASSFCSLSIFPFHSLF